MSYLRPILATALFVLLSSTSAFCEIPQLVNLQGYLSDDNGPVTGSYEATFRIYDDSTGGNILWQETDSVEVVNGLYSQILGDAVPISISWEGDRWIGVQFTGHPEMAPRYRQTSVPYTFLSSYSDSSGTVADDAITGAKVLDGTIEPVDLSFSPLTRPISPGVSTDEIADDAVTSAKIPDGSIQPEDLSFSPVSRPLTPGVSSDEIADNAITTGKIIDGTIQESDLAFTPVSRPLTPGVGTDEINDGAVTSGKILDGTIGLSDLGQNGAGDGQVLKWDNSASSWIIADDATGGGTGWNWADSSSHGPDSVHYSDVSLLSGYSDSTGVITDGAVDLADIGQNGASDGQVMKWDSLSNSWTTAYAGGGGTVTQVSTGTGLTGGPINISGTISIDEVVVPQKNLENYFSAGQTIQPSNDNASLTLKRTYDSNPLSNIFRVQDETGAIDFLSVASDGSVIWTGTASGDISGNAATADFAQNADSLDGMDAGSFALSDHSHTITSADIQDSTILFIDLGQNGAADGQVIKWNGASNSWIPSEDQTGGGGGSGGWADDGNAVRLETITDSVGIGTAAPTEKLEVDGNILVSGRSTFGQYQNNTSQGGLIGGGMNNSISGQFAATLGGSSNNVTGNSSSITGGVNNTVTANTSVIGGGIMNIVQGYWGASTIGGGQQNKADSGWTTIGGGISNHAGDLYATIGGGYGDTVLAESGGISAGYKNSIGTAGYGSYIGGGYNNRINQQAAVIAGGGYNTVDAVASSVVGGVYNTIDQWAYYSSIFGGNNNFIGESSQYSTILGGYADTIAANTLHSYLVGINSNLTQDSTFMIDLPYIRFGNEVDGYRFPAVDGLADQVLATDGSGNLSWVDQSGGGGSGGWVDDGNTIRLETQTDRVGIGVTNPYDKLEVDGNIVGSGSIVIGWGHTAGGSYSSISGGSTNTTLAQYAFIGSGQDNKVDANNSGIVGGWKNYVGNTYAVVGGGYADSVFSQYGGILSGYSNTAGVDGGFSPGAFIGGGRSNKALAPYSVIAGGYGNTVSGSYSSILGGNANNIQSGADHSVLFGYGSTLTQDSTFMVDLPGIRFGDESTGYLFPSSDGVSGQVMSTDGSGQLSWVDMGGGGGSGGWADDGTVVRLETDTDNVGIGLSNPTAKLDIYGDLKVRSKANIGHQNTNAGDYTLVAGYQNEASGLQSSVLGGFQNSVTAARSTIGGGTLNTVDGGFSAVLGGQYNHVVSDYGTVGSGRYDTVLAVGGGVLSGLYNVAGDETADSAAYVGGGRENIATAKYTVISGGIGNTASARYATVAGGQTNSVLGDFGTIGGGSENTVGADGNGTVAGGSGNEALGASSTVPGGVLNFAYGITSFAAGRQAKAMHDGSFVWSDFGPNDFASTAANQMSIRARGGVRIADGNNNSIIELDPTARKITINNTSGSPVVELGEGLDYAEIFSTTGPNLEPGTVMIIDPDNPGQLTVSRNEYDKKVSGIIAGANGLGTGVKLGRKTESGDEAIALAGRVYCKVDASYGSVEPGDLLTTSPTPGYAMVVKDHARAPGSILGKAMEPMAEGEKGKILVLVTLQ